MVVESKTEAAWRIFYRPDEEVHNFNSLPDIIRAMKSSIMNWARYVTRTEYK